MGKLPIPKTIAKRKRIRSGESARIDDLNRLPDSAPGPRKTEGRYLCPNCMGGNVSVLDSRPSNAVWRRRRRCYDCNHRWTTYEIEEATFHALRNSARELHGVRDTLATILAAIDDADRKIRPFAVKL